MEIEQSEFLRREQDILFCNLHDYIYFLRKMELEYLPTHSLEKGK